MASMAWVFLQSRRPVLSMIRVIIIIMLIIIISPYSSAKIHIRCYIEILRNKCKVHTVVSIPSKEKKIQCIIVKSNICTTGLYLKLIY